MTAFIVKDNKSQPYLYAKCRCGKTIRVPELTIRHFAAAESSLRLSESVRRGLKEASERGETFKLVRELKNGRR